MGVEENKEIVRRIVEEAYNKGNLAVMNECTADNFVFHASGHVLVPEFATQGPTSLRSVFLDFFMKIDYMVAEGDMVG